MSKVSSRRLSKGGAEKSFMCEGKDGGGLKMRRVAQQVKGSDFQETFKPITGFLLQKKGKRSVFEVLVIDL